MTRAYSRQAIVFCFAAMAGSVACGGGSSDGTKASTGGASGAGASDSGATTGGSSGVGGGSGGVTGGAGGTAGTGGSSGSTSVPCDQIAGLAQAYKTAHPGNGGKDWDINAKTAAEIAADPDAQKLLSICGSDQRPVIPLIAWEYGGVDHPWINPNASAVAYCVYIPVKNASEHWAYDSTQDHVTADVYVTCPDQNPCKAKQGADQVAACIGDPTNFEILVDTASLHDGADVGLTLANASSDLNLVLPDGSKVHLYSGL
jgi:hypothetical protein